MVTHEPKWNVEMQEWAIQFYEHERQIHGLCGGHTDKTMDATVARDVKFVDNTCLDCQAIETTRAMDHKRLGHKGDVEACKACTIDRVYYVAGYVPKVTPKQPDW